MALKIDAKFEEKLICCFKNDKNLVNVYLSTWNSQNFHLGWFLWCKVYNFWRVTFQDTEKWCKVWRKTDLWFGKWHDENGEFLKEPLKVWELGLQWDPFIQSTKCMSLKFKENLHVMTMKNDAKFEEELTSRLKIDIRNFTNFDSSTQKSQKHAL